LAQRPQQSFPVVTDFQYRDDCNAKPKKSVGYKRRVAIDDLTGGEFVASAQNDRFCNHAV
jgi:hypothetical protein